MFNNLNEEELETIYNSLNQRRIFSEENVIKYQRYDNTWHKEEVKRCENLMIQIEPYIFDKSILELLIKERKETNKFSFDDEF